MLLVVLGIYRMLHGLILVAPGVCRMPCRLLLVALGVCRMPHGLLLVDLGVCGVARGWTHPMFTPVDPEGVLSSFQANMGYGLSTWMWAIPETCMKPLHIGHSCPLNNFHMTCVLYTKLLIPIEKTAISLFLLSYPLG